MKHKTEEQIVFSLRINKILPDLRWNVITVLISDILIDLKVCFRGEESSPTSVTSSYEDYFETYAITVRVFTENRNDGNHKDGQEIHRNRWQRRSSWQQIAYVHLAKTMIHSEGYAQLRFPLLSLALASVSDLLSININRLDCRNRV